MFTKAFILGALENAVVAGAAAFTGSLSLTSGQPTAKGVVAAATAAGIAALYSFVKALGAKQSMAAVAAK